MSSPAQTGRRRKRSAPTAEANEENTGLRGRNKKQKAHVEPATLGERATRKTSRSRTANSEIALPPSDTQAGNRGKQQQPKLGRRHAKQGRGEGAAAKQRAPSKKRSSSATEEAATTFKRLKQALAAVSGEGHDVPAQPSNTAGATRAMEANLWAQGYTHVVGVDEAGRGPLAGPVVAAACCVPAGVVIPGVADSKQLDESQREALYQVITTTPGVVWATASMDHTTIDRVNILQATMLAMKEAVGKLPAGHCDYLLVDGNRLPKDLSTPAQSVVQGDAKVFCIAAASILAKVTRDRMMVQFHQQYPEYNFAQHKGYAVPAHYRALEAHGPCTIHRRSFQPIRGMTGWTREAQLKEEEEKQQSKEEAMAVVVTTPA